MRTLENRWLGIGLAVLLVGCGGGGGGGGSNDSGSTGNSSSGGGVDQTTRIAAAQQTAGSNSDCAAVSPFYYELGDKNGAIVTGSIGSSAPVSSTKMSIASASKWLFGAYVAEVRHGNLSGQHEPRSKICQRQLLLSGYA